MWPLHHITTTHTPPNNDVLGPTHWICCVAYSRYHPLFSPRSAATRAVKAALAAKRLAAQSLK